MNVTSLLVLSIVININSHLKRKVKNLNLNLFKSVGVICYKHQNEFCINSCKRIYNDIANKFYTINDFIIAYIDTLIFQENNYIKLSKINLKKVKKSVDFYSKNRLYLDRVRIKSINSTIKHKNLACYFDIKLDGNSAIYELIKHEERYISPLFYAKYVDKLDINIENEKSKELIRFEKLIQLIQYVLKK